MTLKCIAGIEKPDRGTITLDGRVLFDSEKHINLTPQQRRVGYPFQQYALFPNMTAAQNILCVIRTGSRKEKKETLDAGMTSHMAKPINPDALYEMLAEYKNINHR